MEFIGQGSPTYYQTAGFSVRAASTTSHDLYHEIQALKKNKQISTNLV